MHEALLDPGARQWFDLRTFTSFRPDPAQLAATKKEVDSRISVCLPALNEQETVGDICEAIRGELMERVHLVDELVVVDSGSSDRTREVAAAAGATVHEAAHILPNLGHVPGKGEALWKSLAASDGDLVVWLDADVRNFTPQYVTSLVAPLLLDDGICYVKGFYRRPLEGAAGWAGGRVTELVVRPMLHLLYPELTGVIQPLAGECAGRREVLMQLGFITDYAVETALLLDLAERYGLYAIAQVDLGLRVHRNQDTLALGRMAHQIIRLVHARARRAGRLWGESGLEETFVQFVSGPGGPEPVTTIHEMVERPPMASVLRWGDN